MNDIQLQDLTKQIASFMPGWRFDNRNQYKHLGYLLGPNNSRIYISKERTRGKLRAGGSFPDIYNRQYSFSGGRSSIFSCMKNSDYSSIGFSANKKPELIAKDLKTRLVPVYIAMLHLANKERLAYIEKSDNLIHRVNLPKKIAPGLQDNYHYQRDKNQVHYQHELRGEIQTKQYKVNVKLEYYARSDAVNMNLTGLSDEQVIKILSIIN